MKLSNTSAVIIFLLISIGIFIVDTLLPLGVAVWAAYLFPLAVVFWLLKPEETYALSILSTAFIILGFFFSPEGIEIHYAIINRIIGLAILWELAYMIENRKKTEKLTKFQSDILSRINEPVIAFDNNFNINYWNNAASSLYGFSYSEAINKKIDELLNYKRVNEEDKFQRSESLKTKGFWKGEIIQYTKGGEEIFVTASTSTLEDNKGKKIGYLSVFYNITERRIKDEMIRKSLNEKDILLREIHHRVKNNLQIITSLLNLQSHYIKDKKMINIFEESKGRIRSMSLVHEKLYRSENLKEVNLQSYIAELKDNIRQTYGDNKNIKVNIQTDNFSLDPDKIIIIGLILNELFSNSFKYAFPGNMEGSIEVKIQQEENEKLKIIFSDNGTGIKENIDIKNPKTLGLQIVDGLVRQLNGIIEMDGKPSGIKFTLIL